MKECGKDLKEKKDYKRSCGAKQLKNWKEIICFIIFLGSFITPKMYRRLESNIPYTINKDDILEILFEPTK